MPDADTDQSREAPPSAARAARPTVADAVTVLVQTSVDYVRQEAGDVVHDKVVVPAQTAGRAVAFALAAAFALSLGIGFICVAILLVLAGAIGWPAALFAVGGILVLGAGGFTYLRVRSTQ